MEEQRALERVDGGYGWAVVAGAFIANAIAFGILYSFTVFFPPILSEFGGGRGAVAIIPSVAASLMLGAGGVVGRLTDRFGPSRMIRAGSVLLLSGLVLSAASKSIWQVFLAYGILVGLGASSAFLPSNSAVGQWFARRRGLATGIAVSGSGVGTVIFAPLSQALITTYDWRVALKVIGVAGFVLMLAASILVRGRGGSHRTGMLSAMKSNRTFQIIYLAAFIASYGYWVPFVHIVPYATDHGLTTAAAAGLVSIMGLFNITGRVVLGTIADRFGRRRILQLAVIAMTVSVAAWPLAQMRPALVVFAATYGFFAGTFISLLIALMADYFGTERLAGVTGLMNTAAAAGTLVGAPLSGLLFDASGSYSLSILIAAAAMGAGAVALLFLPSEKTAET